MGLTRFPRLFGVAGWWVAGAVLVGGCSGLTSAPPPSFGGGSDAAAVDGAGPTDTGRGFDGAGGRPTDGGSDLAVDAIAWFGSDTAGTAPAGFDAAGGFGGAAGTGGGGGTAGVTGDASLASPEASVASDDGSDGLADGMLLVDVAAGDERIELVTDGPGEDAGADVIVPLADAAGRDTTARPDGVSISDATSVSFTVNAGADQSVCPGRPATLGAQAQGGTPPYAYAWSANPTCSGCIDSPTTAMTDVVPPATTAFTVTVHDSLNAVATDSVTVAVVNPVADAGPEVSIDSGASVRIGTAALLGYSYAWTCDRPPCALSSATVAQPTVNPKLSTKYTVTVTSPGGCPASDSTMVWVNLPVSTTPQDGETGYPTSASFFVQFGASVLPSSISTDTVSLAETVSGTPVPFTSSYDSSSHVLTIKPTGYNPAVAQYTLTLVGGAGGILSDDSLWPQRLPADVAIAYTLAAAADLTAPIIVSRSPAQLAVNVAINTHVAATFSEALDPTTVAATNFTLSSGPAAGRITVAGTLSYDASTFTLIFVPAASLTAYTSYTVQIGGMKDLSGNPMLTTSWTFTTGVAADNTPPTVTAVVPASGATRVSVVAAVSVTFSESVDPTTLTAGIQVAAGVTPVAGSVTCDTANRVATFTPSAALASQTLYTITVAGVKDLAGNSMTAAFTSTFTTGKVLFSDSFESGTANWTLASPWGLTTSSYMSPTHSLTDSPAGNYAPNVTTSATSVVIDVSNVTSVSLSYWLSGQTQANYDFLWVEYSTNGLSWTSLAYYSGTLDWAQHTQTIPSGLGLGTFAPGTTSLQIRFRMTANASQQFDGVYVDDVIVQAN